MLNLLKNGRFSIASIRKLLTGGFRRKRNRSNTSTGARPDSKVRFILGELFEADNPMTGSDFDCMVSNHAVWGLKAPVKASVSGVFLLQLSPFFTSIFPLFPQKRLIPQATKFHPILCIWLVAPAAMCVSSCLYFPACPVIRISGNQPPSTIASRSSPNCWTCFVVEVDVRCWLWGKSSLKKRGIFVAVDFL